MTYTFRPMIHADLPLVNRWRVSPDVAAWWDEEIDESDLADPNTRLWIVSHQDRAFAFLQDYDPHVHADHHFAHLPAGSRGIDQFIGEADMLGMGHGSALIRVHIKALFAEGAPAVGVDPHPYNTRAIRAYEKAGFTKGETRATQWGLCLLMGHYKACPNSLLI